MPIFICMVKLLFSCVRSTCQTSQCTYEETPRASKVQGYYKKKPNNIAVCSSWNCYTTASTAKHKHFNTKYPGTLICGWFQYHGGKHYLSQIIPLNRLMSLVDNIFYFQMISLKFYFMQKCNPHGNMTTFNCKHKAIHTYMQTWTWRHKTQLHLSSRQLLVSSESLLFWCRLLLISVLVVILRFCLWEPIGLSADSTTCLVRVYSTWHFLRTVIIAAECSAHRHE